SSASEQNAVVVHESPEESQALLVTSTTYQERPPEDEITIPIATSFDLFDFQ
ncbi:unnamed protein product, partial [Rotaria magnacalcarata]